MEQPRFVMLTKAQVRDCALKAVTEIATSDHGPLTDMDPDLLVTNPVLSMEHALARLDHARCSVPFDWQGAINQRYPERRRRPNPA